MKPGDTFGDLTVVKPVDLVFHKEVYWMVRCVCGSVICVPPSAFNDGKLLSCGCVTSVLLIPNGSEGCS